MVQIHHSTGQITHAGFFLRKTSYFAQMHRFAPLLMLLIVVWCKLDLVVGQSPPAFETITTADGLSQGLAYDMIQDRDGFIWIGTKDGLNRYDGYEFRVFTHDPNDPYSISSNAIQHLFEDSQGRIWACTMNDGLSVYDKHSGRFHQIVHDPTDPKSLTGNSITKIVEDSSGYFVVVVDYQELNMFKLDESFFHSNIPPQIVRVPMPQQTMLETNFRNELRGIVADDQGNIYVGGENAFFILNVDAGQLDLVKEGHSFEFACAGSNGSFWGSSPNHELFYWDGQDVSLSLTCYPRDLVMDQNNQLWFTQYGFLYKMKYGKHDPPSVINVPVPEEFPHDQLKSLLIDQRNMMWIGTNGFGLLKLNQSSNPFNHKLAGTSVRSVIVKNNSTILFQNFIDQIFDQEGQIPEDFLGTEASSYLQGSTLFASSGNIWRRFLDTGQHKILLVNYDPSSSSKSIFHVPWHHLGQQPMIEGQDQSIWMAGYDQILTRVDPKTKEVSSYNYATGHLQPNIQDQARKNSTNASTALYESNNGVLWVGNEQGFCKISRSQADQHLQIQEYSNEPGNPNSLSYNHVTSFLDDTNDPDEYLWISTKGGGINRMSKSDGTFIHFDKENGLPDNIVYGILADEQGHIWGSTNQGLFCMLQDSSDEFYFRNFSKSDGLQENEFNTDAFAKLPDGRLVFGGINGYNIFDPEIILTPELHAPTMITNLLVNNQPVQPKDDSGILEEPIEYASKIRLPPSAKIFTLQFAALDYLKSDRVKYRYQLEGAHDQWVENGQNRTATFVQLNPKEYTFRVQGSNSQGLWSNQVAELRIQIIPPWWRSSWATILYLSLVVGAIWIAFRIMIYRSNLRRQLAYEKKEAERVKELDTLKTQLYMNLTHEFRTPLTIILGMAEQIRDQPRQHLRDGIEMIIRNGQNLLGMVNKMLSLSKLEHGKMTLDLSTEDLIHFLRNVVESFRTFMSGKSIQLHYLPEMDSCIMQFDREKLQHVMTNLLSNAYKFTPKDGHIYVSVTPETESNTMRIRVRDTGKGIPEEEIPRIFDRFYQVDNSATRSQDGTGIGLALSKELVHLMEGKLSAQSPPKGARSGTEFILILPRIVGELEKNGQTAETIKYVGLNPIAENSSALTKVTDASQSIITEPILSVAGDSATLILLVEDNKDVASYIQTCLSDYGLLHAENGIRGLQLAKEFVPDLIISDVMMPQMDGFEFCEKIKSDPQTDHIPVVLLTARADMESKLEGLDLGANAYVAKPFEKRELLAIIKNLFSLRDNLKAHLRQIAGLTDSESIELKPEDKDVREDYFVRKVRQVIEEHIDDFNFTVEELAHSVHLSQSQLNRKLDALVGYSANRLIRHLRLDKAKKLLRNSDLSISSIAYECGFNDPSYFSRVFKKEVGETPLQWISKNKVVKK